MAKAAASPSCYSPMELIPPTEADAEAPVAEPAKEVKKEQAASVAAPSGGGGGAAPAPAAAEPAFVPAAAQGLAYAAAMEAYHEHQEQRRVAGERAPSDIESEPAEEESESEEEEQKKEEAESESKSHSPGLHSPFFAPEESAAAQQQPRVHRVRHFLPPAAEVGLLGVPHVPYYLSPAYAELERRVMERAVASKQRMADEVARRAAEAAARRAAEEAEEARRAAQEAEWEEVRLELEAEAAAERKAEEEREQKMAAEAKAAQRQAAEREAEEDPHHDAEEVVRNNVTEEARREAARREADEAFRRAVRAAFERRHQERRVEAVALAEQIDAMEAHVAVATMNLADAQTDERREAMQKYHDVANKALEALQNAKRRVDEEIAAEVADMAGWPRLSPPPPPRARSSVDDLD